MKTFMNYDNAITHIKNQISLTEKEIERITEAFYNNSEEWMNGHNKNHYGFGKAISSLQSNLEELYNDLDYMTV